jgi:hypothetical protein
MSLAVVGAQKSSSSDDLEKDASHEGKGHSRTRSWGDSKIVVKQRKLRNQSINQSIFLSVTLPPEPTEIDRKSAMKNLLSSLLSSGGPAPIPNPL